MYIMEPPVLDSDDPVLQEKLEKDGLILPLSNKVLNLHGEDRDIISFDFRA